jgi:hypothetical protein
LSFATSAAAAALFLTAPTCVTGQTQTSNPNAGHVDQVMGFDQTKTTHHFKLLPDGGVIAITANDPADVASRDAIRQHVAKIETMFHQGDFSAPTAVHGQTPPGADTMKRLKDQLHYATENLPAGGQLHMTTSNSEALKAVHDFLRFQIQEHKTGDSLADPGPAKRKHSTNNLGHDAQPAPP